MNTCYYLCLFEIHNSTSYIIYKMIKLTLCNMNDLDIYESTTHKKHVEF